MFVWQWVQEHRLLSVLVLALVIVSSVGGTAWALIFRTVSSPVDLREALRMYKREQTGKVLSALRSRLPSPGVYSYHTTGDESLSLMGVSRSFPSTTSMVVVEGKCATVSWVPILEHTERTTMCPGPAGAIRVPKLATKESIVGTTTNSVVECPATAYLLPPAAHTGEHWSASCSLENPVEKVVLHGADEGFSTLYVGGHAVTVVHTRLALTFSGGERGTNPIDFSIVPRTGLVVREKETVNVDSGGVHYSENMTATLIGPHPVR